jgi:hypothetical protein
MTGDDHEVKLLVKIEGPHIGFYPVDAGKGAALALGDLQHLWGFVEAKDIKTQAGKLERHPTGAAPHLKQARR